MRKAKSLPPKGVCNDPQQVRESILDIEYNLCIDIDNQYIDESGYAGQPPSGNYQISASDAALYFAALFSEDTNGNGKIDGPEVDAAKRQNYQAPTLDKQLSSLGLNPAEAFSLATLHDTQTLDPSWSTAHGDLYDMLMLQILNELRNDNPAIERLLENTGLNQPIFQCPSTAKNIADLVDFKMLHLFYLSGQARYRAHWIYYPKDVDDIYDQVFLPIAHQLIPILHSDKT